MRSIAKSRSWRAASKQLDDQITHTVNATRADLATFAVQLSPDPSVTSSSPRDIYRDLITLQDEFPVVEADIREKRISVVTESIELEGVYLGPFRVELNWRSMFAETSQCYCVLAEDPNYAESGDDVSHPHVTAGVLCEGEGQQPIQNALTQARLLDFFLIIRHVLNTYNPDSAYVALSDWNGIRCVDCGDINSNERMKSCARCDSIACEECFRICSACMESLCTECTVECVGCQQDYCDRCMENCDGCGVSHCSDCLTELNLCENCYDQASEEDSNADPEIQPNGVGETFVSA